MKGLLVIEPLYHQIIAGEKTQTRRAGKSLEAVNNDPDSWEIGRMSIDEKAANGSHQQFFLKTNMEPMMCKPRYNIGEVLYLKEPYILMGGEPVYKFDLDADDKGRDYVKFKNKLFMPASAARAFIQITGIKCERLFDISDDDCLDEGIEYYILLGFSGWYNYLHKKTDQPIVKFNYPKESFLSLYRLANKIKPKDEIPNIFVWAYTFEYLPNFSHEKD